MLLLFMKLADSLNNREWNSVRQINCLIKLKGKRAGCLKNWVGETELFRKIAQEIAKKLKNYGEFAVQKLTELDTTQKREKSSTVKQLMVQSQELQGKANSLTDAK